MRLREAIAVVIAAVAVGGTAHADMKPVSPTGMSPVGSPPTYRPFHPAEVDLSALAGCPRFAEIDFGAIHFLPEEQTDAG